MSAWGHLVLWDHGYAWPRHSSGPSNALLFRLLCAVPTVPQNGLTGLSWSLNGRWVHAEWLRRPVLHASPPCRRHYVLVVQLS